MFQQGDLDLHIISCASFPIYLHNLPPRPLYYVYRRTSIPVIKEVRAFAVLLGKIGALIRFTVSTLIYCTVPILRLLGCVQLQYTDTGLHVQLYTCSVTLFPSSS